MVPLLLLAYSSVAPMKKASSHAGLVVVIYRVDQKLTINGSNL